MLEWLQQWLNDPNFMPHGHCFLWSRPLLWLYLIGDGLIALAYFSIPLALWYFARKRPHLQYRWVIVLFGVFITACGTTHLIKIWNIWNHAYWLEAWMGIFTGVVSAGCAIVLWPILPRAVALPSVNELQEAYRSLSRRHQELVEVERKLEQLNRELEQRVEDRTQAFEASNRELAQEVVMREYMQQELRASNENLNHYLEELERQNEDITRLNVLSEQLHCCDTHAELLRVLERNCDDLFKSEGGVLLDWYGEQMHQLGAPWGCGVDPAWTPAPQALVALQMGRLFPDSAEQQSLADDARINERYALMVALQSRGNSIGALVLLRSQPFWSGDSIVDDRLEQLLRALADQTALALSNLMLREQLREQSLSDPLTGLYNRRYMYQQLAHLIALWERGGQPFAIILIDVDHFKSFNDRFGHDVGDEVLIAIASLLQNEVRKSDIACRMGGEEFVILMAGATAELACARAEGLRSAVKTLKLTGARNEVVSISAGVALYPDHGDDAFAVMRAADKALYESKHAGRDRISIATADIN